MSQFPLRSLTVSAFDPDLHSTGWASVVVDWHAGKLTPRFVAAGLVQIPQKLHGLEATSAMVAAVATAPPQAKMVWVEAQEVYADGKADANDLLRLAQITGAIQMKFNATPVLPKVWKGNKAKEGMHQRARQAVGPAGTTWEEAYPQRLRQHAWDAICLALWAATQHLTKLDKDLMLSRGESTGTILVPKGSRSSTSSRPSTPK